MDSPNLLITSSLLHSLRLIPIFFFLLFLIDVPSTCYAEDDRPRVCGGEGFNLTCGLDNDDDPLIYIGNDQTFRVIDIIEPDHTMIISRKDVWELDKCPEKFNNETLNETLFELRPDTKSLLLAYGCPEFLSTLYPTTNFNCIINGSNSLAVFLLNDPLQRDLGKNLNMCKEAIEVLVSNRAFDEVQMGKMELKDALNQQFSLGYKPDGNCSACDNSGGICESKSSSLHQFVCLCRDQYCKAQVDRGSGRNLLIKLLIGIGGGLVAICISVAICCLRRMVSSNSRIISWSRNRKNDQNVEDFIRQHGSLTPKRYSYSDIKIITNSLKNKLGQGGYGGVYKGKMLDGRLVAVKVLKESKGNGEEFINEVASISRTSHVNVVTLLGFCFEGHKRALIYEFMPNGSLEKFIYGGHHSIKDDRNLGWEKLYQIAIGIARGLEYLHLGCNTRILHFDIKPHNILLDDDFCPKIADFGLAKLCPTKESIISMLGARGTIGYIAPEVYNRNFGGVSHKSDVYSYGSMILEMVGGRKNINVGVSQTSEIYFPHWIYKRLELDNDFILESVMTDEENEIARKMVLVGLWCIQTNPSQRPSISNVINMFEGTTEALQIPPKPFLSSPSRPPENSSTPSATSIL